MINLKIGDIFNFQIYNQADVFEGNTISLERFIDDIKAGYNKYFLSNVNSEGYNLNIINSNESSKEDIKLCFEKTIKDSPPIIEDRMTGNDNYSLCNMQISLSDNNDNLIITGKLKKI